jgi:hypothetical protein
MRKGDNLFKKMITLIEFHKKPEILAFTQTKAYPLVEPPGQLKL